MDCNEPHLGLATTKQLIDELAARADVSATIGESWPSYSTVEGRISITHQKISRFGEDTCSCGFDGWPCERAAAAAWSDSVASGRGSYDTDTRTS